MGQDLDRMSMGGFGMGYESLRARGGSEWGDFEVEEVPCHVHSSLHTLDT